MTVVRVQHASWEVVVETPAIYGDAGSVAARLRAEGVQARKKGNEVLVNANADLEPSKRR